MLTPDDAAVAARAAAGLPEPRLRHFWDPRRLAGRALRRTLGLPTDAWDVYLLYRPGAHWADEPSAWVHQLSEVGGPRYRTGDALVRALEALVY